MRFKVDMEEASPCASQREFSVLLRRFSKALINFYIAYVPLFPVFSPRTSPEEARIVLSCLTALLKEKLPSSTLMIRFDADLTFYEESERDAFNRKLSSSCALVKAKNDIQPPDSVLIELTKSEEEILSLMKSKWRYNISLSSRKGVEIRQYENGSEGFDLAFKDFYSIFRVTAERDKIAIHKENYYRSLFEADSKIKDETKTVKLFCAYYEGEMLAAIIVLFTDNEAIYLYGASSNEKRNLMPTYLLQWHAILAAKKHGSSFYDLYGIPPNEEENHPMAGLYRFKTGFGGKKIHRIGSYDAPLKKMYFAFRIVENLRVFYYKSVKKFFTHSKR